MKVIKQGQQRLFEQDLETAAVVSRMLIDLEKNGMDAVRQYSRRFDEWDPPSFRLSPRQIEDAIGELDEQAIRDTDFCQANVRSFAEAQLRTMLPLEVETRPGVMLGPEHLELHVANVDYFFGALRNYGSLFIGEETTVAYGDKTIGTNHILPTSRAARYTGGLWVGKFLKTCTYQRMTPAASVETARVTERQCVLEHMLAHAITARVRVDRYSRKTSSTQP